MWFLEYESLCFCILLICWLGFNSFWEQLSGSTFTLWAKHNLIPLNTLQFEYWGGIMGQRDTKMQLMFTSSYFLMPELKSVILMCFIEGSLPDLREKNIKYCSCFGNEFVFQKQTKKEFISRQQLLLDECCAPNCHFFCAQNVSVISAT